MKIEKTTVKRVLVTGAPKWNDVDTIASILSTLAANQKAAKSSFRVITGMADGADAVARDWATNNRVNLHVERLGPGKIAPAIHACNERMLSLRPELILAFKSNFDEDWANNSRTAGCEHMCRIAARAGIPVLLNGVQALSITDEPDEADSDAGNPGRRA